MKLALAQPGRLVQSNKVHTVSMVRLGRLGQQNEEQSSYNKYGEDDKSSSKC